jgi:hypothetical protein
MTDLRECAGRYSTYPLPNGRAKRSGSNHERIQSTGDLQQLRETLDLLEEVRKIPSATVPIPWVLEHRGSRLVREKRTAYSIRGLEDHGPDFLPGCVPDLGA